MDFEYFTIQPNKWTFSETKIRDWITDTLPSGQVLNACAGNTKLDVDETTIIRNDLNPNVDADSHVAVRNLPDIYTSDKFEAIIFDSPFTPAQADKHYDGYDISRDSLAPYEALDEILAPGSVLITFGYRSALPPTLQAQYRQESLTLWNLLGRQADWFSTVHRKPTTDRNTLLTQTAASTERGITPVNPEAKLSADTIDRVTIGGNNGEEIDLSHIVLSPDDSEAAKIQEVINSLKQGLTGEIASDTSTLAAGPNDYRIIIEDKHSRAGNFTLDSFQGPTQPTAHNGATADASPIKITNTETLSGPGDRPPGEAIPVGVMGADAVPDFTATPDEIPPPASDARYQTLIFNFHDGVASHNTETETLGSTGFGTAIKHAADARLADGGQCIQIGRTATNMPQEHYVRDRVVIISHPDSQYETIIAADRPTDDDRPARPTRSLIRADQRAIEAEPGGFNYECVGCGMTWHYHPAHYTDCPDCGAHSDNFCVDTDDRIKRTPHDARIREFTSRHSCK